ncbi:hypothetical protein GCM10029976_042390 [Kribbella albertanoniae]|uniref:hypothetical protein n=1 Tax=Kribbella albertanoniae TaxID=1266829 RepID=UPI00140482F2|nr:hypothetical protein [Kribbella albertanoniae]
MDHIEAWKKGLGSRIPDPNAVPTAARLRQLLEVSHAATRFYRRELFRDKKSWPRNYLERGGALAQLDTESRWLVGYAPDSRSRLVDHLRATGFDLTTIRNAGLGVLGADGRLVDRFRDQLMLPARDHRLQIVGFTGVRRSSGAVYYTTSPDTQIHRRSGSVIGIAEQLELLAGEASPVLVDDPLDAFAIENVSRLSGGRWAGIPLCGALLSADQARILGARAVADTVVVVVSENEAARQRAIEILPDLAKAFRRVQAVDLPRAFSPATLRMRHDGLQRLHDELLLTRPLADYRSRPRRRRTRERPAGDVPLEMERGPSPEL